MQITTTFLLTLLASSAAAAPAPNRRGRGSYRAPRWRNPFPGYTFTRFPWPMPTHTPKPSPVSSVASVVVPSSTPVYVPPVTSEAPVIVSSEAPKSSSYGVPASASSKAPVSVSSKAPVSVSSKAPVSVSSKSEPSYSSKPAANPSPYPTTTAAAPPSSSDASDPYYGADVYVKQHNLYRANHHAADVVWNQTIAEHALANAAQCKMEHTSDTDRARWGVGENLYAMFGASGSPEGAVKAWYGECTDESFQNGVYIGTYNHFTQVVWTTTTSIGCARVKCPDAKWGSAWYYTCQYAPPGNIQGQFKEKVLPPIKKMT